MSKDSFLRYKLWLEGDVLFALNRQLAKIMSLHPEYEPHIHEVHHTKSWISPVVGRLWCQGLIANSDLYSDWTLEQPGESPLLGNTVGVPVHTRRGSFSGSTR